MNGLEPMLLLTRGLPGSGKSTWAEQWAGESTRRVMVNRDLLREMLHGGWKGDRESEDQVTDCQVAIVRLLLLRGLHVVCHDTNLDLAEDGMPHRLWRLAMQLGAGFAVRDFTDVPVETCVHRDRQRALAGHRSVGAVVIRTMHDRYLAGQVLPLPVPGKGASYRFAS